MTTSGQTTEHGGGTVKWVLGIWACVATLALVGLFYGGYVNLLHNSSAAKIGDLSKTVDSMEQRIRTSENGLSEMSHNIAALSSQSASSAAQLTNLFKDADTVSKGLTQALSGVAQSPELAAQIATSGLSDVQKQQMQDYYEFYANPAVWPKTADARSKKRDETADFFNSLGEGQKILVYTSPDFQRMSWHHEIMVATDPSIDADPKSLERRITALATLMDAAPENVSPAVQALGESHITKLNTAAISQRKTIAQAEAKAALAKNADFDRAFAGLLEFDDADNTALRERLQEKIRENSILGDVERLKRDYGVLNHRDASDPLRNMGVVRIYQAVSDLSLSASDLQDSPAKKNLSAFQNTMQKAVDDISKKQQEEEQQKHNAYQLWTLEQLREWDKYNFDSVKESYGRDIPTFNPKNSSRPNSWPLFDAFPDTVGKIVKEQYNVLLNPQRYKDSFATAMNNIFNSASVVGSTVRDYKGQVEMAAAVHQAAMKKFLMPVDTRYLEPPVLELYNQAWRKGWDKLDETSRLNIANASAEISKKLP